MKLRTLRGRLAVAMVVIFIVALGVSAALNRIGAPVNGAGASNQAEYEPYQDGLVLAGFSLPALLIIWLISSWSLQPLARASAEARLIGPRDAAARISRQGLPAEITPLVDAVNGALDRMAAAFEAERRFTENAAHELRTPLAVLGVRLQRARHAQENGGGGIDWAAIDRDLAHMNRLVGQLLDLARKENAGRKLASADLPAINLSRIAREACAMVLPLVEAQGRRIDIDLPETLPAQGAADDLRDAIGNLLENAALHGSGVIGLRGVTDNDGIVLTISDEGPGIAAELGEAAFERFRKDPASHGTGLGLAIVREVVRSHGGRVTVLAGAGCRVSMWLPATPPKT